MKTTTISNWICPRCGSEHINHNFDFINYCKDCYYEWEV